ncbi:MAG: hypothetical protein KA764_10300 [Anaerolineales bacterium]|nr:hypothetical protein [Anaerolineales bacterium]
MRRCPLCQAEFDDTQSACHAGCPLAALQGCHLICCPHCGYQQVDERQSNLARALRRLWPARPAEESPAP